jgi:hypothetical protein
MVSSSARSHLQSYRELNAVTLSLRVGNDNISWQNRHEHEHHHNRRRPSAIAETILRDQWRVNERAGLTDFERRLLTARYLMGLSDQH